MATLVDTCAVDRMLGFFIVWQLSSLHQASHQQQRQPLHQAPGTTPDRLQPLHQASQTIHWTWYRQHLPDCMLEGLIQSHTESAELRKSHQIGFPLPIQFEVSKRSMCLALSVWLPSFAQAGIPLKDVGSRHPRSGTLLTMQLCLRYPAGWSCVIGSVGFSGWWAFVLLASSHKWHLAAILYL